MKSLVWFRNDLRMYDNPALRAACSQSKEVHGVYIYSKNQLGLHNEANSKIEFIIENLKSLEQSLNKINIPLTVISSDGFNEDPKKILNLLNERSIKNIHWNNQFGIDEESRDKKVEELLIDNNINSFSYDSQTLFPAGTFKTGEGKPYSVFTPFKKKIVAKKCKNKVCLFAFLWLYSVHALVWMVSSSTFVCAVAGTQAMPRPPQFT